MCFKISYVTYCMGLYKNDEDITKKCLLVSVGFSKIKFLKFCRILGVTDSMEADYF